MWTKGGIEDGDLITTGITISLGFCVRVDMTEKNAAVATAQHIYNHPGQLFIFVN